VSEPNGRCIIIVDGDTFRGETFSASRLLDTASVLTRAVRVRLLGVACPEKREPGGPEATAFATAWFQEHAHPELELPGTPGYPLRFDGETFDSFGRLLAIVTCTHDGSVLNTLLLTSGNATVYRRGLHAVAHADALLRLEAGGVSEASLLLAVLGTPR
jgi:endonuclease YncB( thermonuclease family)